EDVPRPTARARHHSWRRGPLEPLTLKLRNRRIFVGPAFNAFYYSFYVNGLRKALPNASLHYSRRRFPAFESNKFAFEVDVEKPLRVLIDAHDRPRIDPDGMAWCDIYGKVNYLASEIAPAHLSTVVAIGPNFAVRTWGLPRTAFMAARNYAKARRG